jgi:hypothetical protein
MVPLMETMATMGLMKKLMSVNHTLKEGSTNGFQRIELLRQN